MPDEGVASPQPKKWELHNREELLRRTKRVVSDAIIKGDSPAEHKALAIPTQYSADSNSKGVASAGITGQADDQEQVQDPLLVPPDGDCIYDVTPECIRGTARQNLTVSATIT